ncbi:MAG TPA: spondin domain-containing protein [Thermoanaerobaculia bacterium]
MRKVFVLAILVVLTAGLSQAFAADNATYKVTFIRLWTQKTHPFEYPEPGLLTGPHLSGLIGATHAAGSYAVYKIGTPPTPGLERLSEEGKHSPLDQEIKDAIAAGKAGALFETGPIRDASKTETVNVTVTSRFPMVSAVAMIAPSPDWFAGIAEVNLMEGGKWVSKKTVDLFAYDSGGDDGTTYKAADIDTNPKKPTTLANTPHFVIKGKRPPVARLMFTKM